MLRKTMIVAFAAALCSQIAPRAASAGDHYPFEYGAGWGEGVVYGPGHYTTPHNYPVDYPYKGYPYVGYDGPPFFLGWDYGADCYVMSQPGHRRLHGRAVQLCD
jgi:hypothetical protein